MDYHFLGSEKHPGEPTLTLLTIKLVGTGAVHSILGHKGVSGYMIAAVCGALEVWGVDQIVLKTDQEPSIIALGAEIAEYRRPRGTICRTVPRESHASLGAGEQANQEISGQVRCLKAQLEDRLKQHVPSDHMIMAWIVRHAGWLITRYAVRADGRTGYEATRGRTFRGELAEVGERIWTRIPGGNTGSKLEAKWEPRIWLGKTETSDEHLVADRNGTKRTRTVRRRPESERFSMEELLAFKGAPWDLKAAGGQ